jgi:hypothetical protein
MPVTIRIELSADSLAKLTRPVVGQGGFQSLLRQVQRQVDGNVLVLTPSLIERIAQYVHAYGGGGFQGRLEAVLRELATLARLLEPIAA